MWRTKNPEKNSILVLMFATMILVGAVAIPAQPSLLRSNLQVDRGLSNLDFVGQEQNKRAVCP